jgi:hypothetical protein
VPFPNNTTQFVISKKTCLNFIETVALQQSVSTLPSFF